MWAFDNSFSTIKEATYNPQMYRDLALLTELTSQNTWDLQSHVGMPLNYQEGSMSQDARLQLIINTLKRRQLFQEKLIKKFGTTTFQVLVGNMTPLEFRMTNTIDTGIIEIELLDATRYENDSRIQFGFINFDYEENTLIVTQLHKKSNIIDNQGNISNRKNLGTVLSNRKKSVRKAMQQDRNRILNPYETETPGIEELMIYLASGLFAETDSTKPIEILIPAAGVTYYGSTVNPVLLNNTLYAGFQSEPEIVKNRIYKLYRKHGQIPSSPDTKVVESNIERNLLSTPTEGAFGKYKIINSHGEKIPIREYLLNLMISQIDSEHLVLRENLRSIDLYNDEQWKNLIKEFIKISPAYLQAFASHESAFSDVPSVSDSLERRINVTDIFRLPFAKAIQTIPIKEV